MNARMVRMTATPTQNVRTQMGVIAAFAMLASREMAPLVNVTPTQKKSVRVGSTSSYIIMWLYWVTSQLTSCSGYTY